MLVLVEYFGEIGLTQGELSLSLHIFVRQWFLPSLLLSAPTFYYFAFGILGIVNQNLESDVAWQTKQNKHGQCLLYNHINPVGHIKRQCGL